MCAFFHAASRAPALRPESRGEPGRRPASLGLLAALWLGLLLPPAHAAAGASTNLVWPPPPAEPRIAFVQTITGPADLGVKESALTKFANWLTGTKRTGELVKPFGVAVDDQGNLCLTDSGANTVCYFDRAAKKWQRWDKIGRTNFLSPVAVAKHQQTLFVADSGLRKVLALSLKGKLLFEITNGLDRPVGLTVANDRLYVADATQHRVCVFGPRGAPLFTFGRRGVGSGEFNFPTHLAADAQGRLYVTDSLNCRVQRFEGDGKYLGRIGEAGNVSGHFTRPKGVAVDAAGHIYVIDAMFDNIQVFDPAGRFLLDLGQSGSGTGDFWLPSGLAISRDNLIYVADSYNHRIQVLKYIGKP